MSSINKFIGVCLVVFSCFSLTNAQPLSSSTQSSSSSAYVCPGEAIAPSSGVVLGDTGACSISDVEWNHALTSVRLNIKESDSVPTAIEIAAYICLYGTLPSTIYLTEGDCQREFGINRNKCNSTKLWNRCHRLIGGKVFNNSRYANQTQRLPVQTDSSIKYYEADVKGSGNRHQRGSDRIVYTIRNDSCYVYYTQDHYCTFCSFPVVVNEYSTPPQPQVIITDFDRIMCPYHYDSTGQDKY